jgi:hypothetical protein
MLKKLLCVVVLVMAVGAISGCHAGVHGDEGHGADVNVG